jgi:hypothetical protein
MSSEVKQLGPEHVTSLRALLSGDPLRNLHPLAVLDERGISQGPSSGFYGYFSSRQLRAAAFVQPSSGLMMPGACQPSDALALGTGLAGKFRLRSCYGDKQVVEALVESLCRSKPRWMRVHRLFTASADNLGPFVTPALRLANEGDLPQLVSMAARETEEVFEGALSGEDAEELKAEILERIRARRTWVLELDSRLALKVEVAAQCSFGAELQGVFTVPEARLRGYATLALGQLSRHLLSSLPRLSLRIAESADSLLAVARKVGYVNGQVEQLLVLN